MSTAAFTLVNRVDQPALTILTAISREGEVWTLVTSPDGDTVVTPSGGHVAPADAAYAGTLAFLRFAGEVE